MYRVRLHGRGGQGIKTASRILGNALFREGYEVQDAPRYGAERRGAPIFAYVRASRQIIHERGVISRPDLVVVADDSLVPVPAAGVLQGVAQDCTLLIYSHESAAVWRQRLNTRAQLLVLPSAALGEQAALAPVGAACAGAAARLLGVIGLESLQEAVREELADLDSEVIGHNLAAACQAFAALEAHAGGVKEGGDISAQNYAAPEWVTLPFDSAQRSAPTIHAAATSVMVRTGLWRSFLPVIDYDRCSRCWWVCSTFCPDGAINVLEDGRPQIDYEHCKGCMVCVAQCPPHAISAVPESSAQEQASQQGASS
jgi:pyruvate ferredoxin oxidoreductase gamma subunit